MLLSTTTTNLVYVNWGKALQKAIAARLAWPG